MDDLISRQAAIDAINEHLGVVTSGLGNNSEAKKIYKMAYNHVIDAISILPAIQPKQKTGRWIYTNTIGGLRYYGCTICANQEKDCIADEHEIQWYNYCPNCGAKMEGTK